MKLVMDTDTIVAAMRSAGGASAELLRLARTGRIVLAATAPLCLEYEAVCSRPEHLIAASFSNGRANAIVTFNRRDFRAAAERFGLDLLLPSEAIRKVT